MTEQVSKSVSATKLLERWVMIRPDELRKTMWSFAYFFSVLCSYYVLRPIREQLGVAAGIGNLQWLFLATFVVMLIVAPMFGRMVSRYPRKKFLPLVYYFFIGNIILFYFLFLADLDPVVVGRVFFVWISVFNLFVVSVFWSFMADVFSFKQSRRLFGFIAAGGTAGALVGPLITAILAKYMQPNELMLVSAFFLGIAVLCIHKLGDEACQTAPSGPEQPIGGKALEGLRLVMASPYLRAIASLVILASLTGTFLYYFQVSMVAEHFSDPATRTAVFSWFNFASNTLTVILQVFITPRLMKRYGMRSTLVIIPLLTVISFMALAIAPLFFVMAASQIIRRGGAFGVMNPAVQMLFTTVDPEAKYKAKNVIDTAVYRLGDVISSWTHKGMSVAGLGISEISLVAVPLAGLWVWTCLRLGTMQDNHQESAVGEAQVEQA